jgi:hypothetical protein
MSHNTKHMKDLRFGWLTVLRRGGSDGNGTAMWWCRCDCGVERIFRGDHLRRGRVKSCGGHRNNGSGRGPEYRSWYGMISRCADTDNKNYGARGITVCKRWERFENFLADMGQRPGPGYSIDRVDGNGNYEPGNCRWATALDQNRNRRDTVFVYFGVPRILAELCDDLGLSRSLVYGRLNLGWPIDEALSRPSRQYRRRAV